MNNNQPTASFCYRFARARSGFLQRLKRPGRLLALTILCLMPISLPVFAEIGNSGSLQQKLETAFMLAFSDPVEFQNTRVFQLLGYSSTEIAEIGKITPRPSTITVHAESNGQPDCFKSISVSCTKVLYYNLTIDRVTFEFPDCRLCPDALNNGRLLFLGADQIKLKTEVSSEDIARVFDLVARARQLTSLRIKLDKNLAIIRGRVKRGLLVVDFNLNGDTELVDSKTVIFRCDRMVMNGFRLPRNTVNGIFRQINPVFDARKTWLNLNIASINIRRGFVETIATIERRKG